MQFVFNSNRIRSLYLTPQSPDGTISVPDSGKAEKGTSMGALIRIGDCVKIPDGRIVRVRERLTGAYKVRVRSKTSKTHQFLIFPVDQLKLVDCPKGWMSREGYNRYLKITLAKMEKRLAARRRSKK